MARNDNPQYDVFISYRRDGGAETAKHLRDVLTERGYRVFFDTDSLRSGDFNLALLSVIAGCTDFIIILSPNSLDRCSNPKDWVRQELACALTNKKNVIPIMSKSFVFPETLPPDIDGVRWKNGIAVNIEYFDAMIDKLTEFLLSKPVVRDRINPVIIAAAALIVAAVVLLPMVFRGVSAPADGSATQLNGSVGFLTNTNGTSSSQSSEVTDADKSEDSEDEVTPSYASILPRAWTGTFGGKDRDGNTSNKDMQLSLTEVTDDGHLKGLCTIGASGTDNLEGSGSYYVEGQIDWDTRSIELWGTEWAEQGGLSYMRRYSGTVDSSFESIGGTCELMNGGSVNVWQMKKA